MLDRIDRAKQPFDFIIISILEGTRILIAGSLQCHAPSSSSSAPSMMISLAFGLMQVAILHSYPPDRLSSVQIFNFTDHRPRSERYLSEGIFVADLEVLSSLYLGWLDCAQKCMHRPQGLINNKKDNEWRKLQMRTK